MTDTTKLEKWAFPFKTAGASSAEVTDPQLYYTALAKADNGFYPMGANGLWHGGVHFDANTGALLDQSAVRCIADGEVIAYRIDERYPTSQYGEGPAVVHLPFSSGFVLVKHRLTLPAAAPVAAATPATATPGAPAPVAPATATPTAEALTFYSLYMHLLDWAGYQAQTALARPEFWGEGLYQVKADAPDKVLGLNVREHHKVANTDANYAKYENKLTTLPRGTTIETGEAAPSPNQNWRKLVRVIPAVAGLTENTGWVYVLEAKKLEENRYLVTEKDSTDIPALEQIGLHVREAASGGSNVLAVLPRSTQIKISSEGAMGKYRKLVTIVSGEPVPKLTEGEGGSLPGFVWLDSLEAKSEPKTKDSVVVLEAPVAIKAGELIGHLGQYQNYDEATARALLHLEVFSCEEVPAFIAKSRALAAQLPPAQKTLLKIHKGASKLIPHREGISASSPPQISDEGVTVGVDLIIPQSLLDTLPSSSKILVPAKNDTWACSSEIRWWRLDGLLADNAGNPISGWIAEQDLITTRHSPWEWQGFDFISETTSASEQLANHLAGQCLLSETELPDYQTHISTADNGPIKTRLYDIIDGADGTTRNEKLSAAEIRAALGKPWHAQSISQLISHYESEWYWQDGKWDELDKLMEHTPATPNTDWVAEKARIKTLAWWNKVEGQHGIKADGMAWHFQPTGMISNFINKGGKIKITVAMLKKVFEGLTNTNEADELLSEIANQINENCERYKLDSTLRLSHFFARVRQEIGSKCRVVEDFTYSPEGLKGTFRYFRVHPSEATTYGYAGSSKFVPTENQIAIANRAYASRYDNGDISSEDGWRYRWRGLKHLTFRSNYTTFKEYHKNFWGEDVDFVQSPNLPHENYKYSVRSGVYFWLSNNLFTEADKGATDSTVDAITRIINESTDSYGKRRDNFKRIFENEKIFKDI